MTCLTCQSAALRCSTDDRRDRILRSMARVGFVSCTNSPAAATFKPFTSTCKTFSPADEKTAEARRQWAETKGQKA